MLDLLGERVETKEEKKHEILYGNLSCASSSWLFMSNFLPPGEEKKFLVVDAFIGRKEGRSDVPLILPTIA